MPRATPDGLKECSKCREVKPVAEFFKSGREADGLTYNCKSCFKVALNDWRARNPEKTKAQNSRRHYKDVEESKRKLREYYAENKDKLRPTRSKWLSDNADRVRKVKRAWVKANREKVAGQSKVRQAGPAPVGAAVELTITEAPFVRGGMLFTLCTYCGRYFNPSYVQVRRRISALQGKGRGECRLYCSDGCKRACPIYNRKKYAAKPSPSTSREVQPELRKLALARDGHVCTRCGAGVACSLHVHHIDPVNTNPIESADLDNVITVCVECHKKLHRKPGCGLNELRCGEEGP